jgi:hypothetical protein
LGWLTTFATWTNPQFMGATLPLDGYGIINLSLSADGKVPVGTMFDPDTFVGSVQGRMGDVIEVDLRKAVADSIAREIAGLPNAEELAEAAMTTAQKLKLKAARAYADNGRSGPANCRQRAAAPGDRTRVAHQRLGALVSRRQGQLGASRVHQNGAHVFGAQPDQG